MPGKRKKIARLKKRNKQLTRQINREPYDPLEPSFNNRKQFNRAVRRRARSQIQPAMSDLGRQTRLEAARHEGREQDLQRWNQFNLGAHTDAYGRVNDALNSLITMNSGLSTASQGALSAALRGSAATEAEQAANLGVQAQYNPEAAITASQGMADVGTLGTLGALETGRQASARDIGIAGLAGQESAGVEARRYQSVLDELDASRREIRSQIPGFREEARAAINQEEQGKAAQRFQQDLAGKEFGLSRKQFRLQKRGQKFQEGLAGRQQREAERAAREQERQGRATIQINREQLDISRQEIAAQAQADLAAAQAEGNKAAVEEAKARAKRFDNAATWLENYLQPADDDYRGTGKDKKFSDKRYKARTSFDDALRTIQARFGLGENAALMVMGSTTNSGWAKEAAKRRRKIQDDKMGITDYREKGKGRQPGQPKYGRN